VLFFHGGIRGLTDWVRQQLPPGRVIHGRARSGGVRLRVPDSRSEEDFAIDMGWIVTSDRPGRERVLDVTRTALASLQTAVAETTSTSWPDQTRSGAVPEAHAEIAGDTVNPELRLWYGPSHAPVLELKPRILLNMILHD
jgi:hypothetical protein